jgi:hypothetical protein
LATLPGRSVNTVTQSTEVDEQVKQQLGPEFPLGGPTSAAWREDALTRAKELEGLTAWAKSQSTTDSHGNGKEPDETDGLVKAISAHIQGARDAAEDEQSGDSVKLRPWKAVKASSCGSSFERALGNLDAAEAHILRLAPPSYLMGLLPSLQAHVNRYLAKNDPRRERLSDLVGTAKDRQLTDADRTAVVAAYHAANSQRRREFFRLRSFRNVILAAAGLMLVVAVLLAGIGALHPQMIPICFHVTDQAKVVCPTAEAEVPAGAPEPVDETIDMTVSGLDILLIETLGLVAAALASAFALRGIRGTSMPYSLPVALALLKLPTGALTAVLGLLLMRGGFVPGLSALDTPAQILSWAIVFGYAQQLFTRFVDQQGHAVLEDVRGKGATGDRDASPRPAV